MSFIFGISPTRHFAMIQTVFMGLRSGLLNGQSNISLPLSLMTARMFCRDMAWQVIFLDASGQGAFKMEFYIVNEIILICLSVDCYIYKLKLRDTLRRHEIAPTL